MASVSQTDLGVYFRMIGASVRTSHSVTDCVTSIRQTPTAGSILRRGLALPGRPAAVLRRRARRKWLFAAASESSTTALVRARRLQRIASTGSNQLQFAIPEFIIPRILAAAGDRLRRRSRQRIPRLLSSTYFPAVPNNAAQLTIDSADSADRLPGRSESSGAEPLPDGPASRTSVAKKHHDVCRRVHDAHDSWHSSA